MKGHTTTTKTKKNLRAIRLLIVSLICIGVALSVAAVGISYVVNRKFTETFYNVSSLKVNNKIRIIQISDLHDCVYGTENEKLLDRVKKLSPDLILLTGDIIDASNVSIERVLNLCMGLAEIAPSYYIYGNNEVERVYGYPLTRQMLDKYMGYDDTNRNPSVLREMPDVFEEKIEATGVRVLKNEAETITVGTTKVDVYGVLTSNPSSFWSYGGESFNDYLYTNENHLKVTAFHEPQSLEVYEPEFWGDILLAGHTHGGLVRIPMVGPLYTPEGGILPARNDFYVYGRYSVQGNFLVVSGGLENNNLFRINNEPEIVIIDINKF